MATAKQPELDAQPVSAADWRAKMLAEFEINDPAALAILDAAEVQLARMISLRSKIAEHGEVVPDRFGQLKPNPAVGMESRATNAFRLLLRELGVTSGEEEGPHIPRGSKG